MVYLPLLLHILLLNYFVVFVIVRISYKSSFVCVISIFLYLAIYFGF